MNPLSPNPRRRRAADRKPPGPNAPPRPVRGPVGSTGARVMSIGPVDAEVAESIVHGERVLSLATFEIPGSGGVWAVVAPSRSDGSAWMVGLTHPDNRPGGWQHDEFPTIYAAVAAVCDLTLLPRIEQRTAAAHRLAELRRKADALATTLAAPLSAEETPDV